MKEFAVVTLKCKNINIRSQGKHSLDYVYILDNQCIHTYKICLTKLSDDINYVGEFIN